MAAVTKDHRLDGLKHKNLFLTALDAPSPKSRCWQGRSHSEVSLLVGDHLLAVCSHGFSSVSVQRPKGTAGSLALSCKGTDASWPYLSLVTSQGLCYQIPSHWGLGLQKTNFEGTQTFSSSYQEATAIIQVRDDRSLHDIVGSEGQKWLDRTGNIDLKVEWRDGVD